MSDFPSDQFRRGAANRDPEEEAIAWVARLTSGEVSETDRLEFSVWKQDEENARAFEAARRLWGALGPILEDNPPLAPPRPKLVAFPPAEQSAPEDEPAGEDIIAFARPKRRRFMQFAAIAATIMLSVGLGYEYLTTWRFDYVAPSATRIAMKLPDGSQATVAPGSAFDTRFEHGVRRVELARGEAFFDVKHDPAHPFIVSAGDGEVRVLGTAFAVRRTDNGATVVVQRGKVRVSTEGREEVLTPDRSVTYANGQLSKLRAVDASLALAWTRGRLILENQPLSAVLAEIDRYDSRRIVLLNGEAANRRINAVVDLERIDSWLDALETSQKLTVRRLGPVVVLN